MIAYTETADTLVIERRGGTLNHKSPYFLVGCAQL
jgi:hypothetical protein